MVTTLEQLAEKLNGNLWIKGDMKRIYLDRGYNTKKMSTKTFVFQDESGDFKVSCRVDCPAQPWQWCKSQEDEIKESVYEQIEEALSETVYILTDTDGRMIDWQNNQVALNDCSYELTENAANEEIGNNGFFTKFITMPRDEFEKEVERLDEIERPERERKAAELPAKREEEAKKINDEKKKASEPQQTSSVAIPEPSSRVKHAKFGIGTVISSNSNFIEIHFDNQEFGTKKLTTLYAKLEKVEA